MFEMLIMLSFIAVLALIYFFSKNKFLVDVEITHFASAGSADYDDRNVTMAKIPKKMAAVARHENLTLVKVIGNSAQKVGVKNNNIVAIKMTNDINDIKAGEVIYLKYNKYPNKFKLREFTKTSNELIYSQTLDNGILRGSSHDIDDLVGVARYTTTPL